LADQRKNRIINIDMIASSNVNLYLDYYTNDIKKFIVYYNSFIKKKINTMRKLNQQNRKGYNIADMLFQIYKKIKACCYFVNTMSQLLDKMIEEYGNVILYERFTLLKCYVSHMELILKTDLMKGFLDERKDSLYLV